MGALTNGGTVVVDSDRDSLPSSDEESRPNGAEELTRAVNTIAANRNVSSITLRTPVMDATIELGDNLTPRNRLRDVLEVGGKDKSTRRNLLSEVSVMSDTSVSDTYDVNKTKEQGIGTEEMMPKLGKNTRGSTQALFRRINTPLRRHILKENGVTDDVIKSPTGKRLTPILLGTTEQRQRFELYCASFQEWMKWQQAQGKFKEKGTGKLMVDGEELFYEGDIDDDTANRIGAFLDNEEAFKYLSPLLRKILLAGAAVGVELEGVTVTDANEMCLGGAKVSNVHTQTLKNHQKYRVKLLQLYRGRYSERPGVMERLGKGEKSVERSTLQGAKPGKNDNRMGLYEMLVLTNCILHRTMKDKWHANRDTCDQS